jgi:hypothetical protein
MREGGQTSMAQFTEFPVPDSAASVRAVVDACVPYLFAQTPAASTGGMKCAHLLRHNFGFFKIIKNIYYYYKKNI